MRDIEWPPKPKKRDFWYYWYRFWLLVVALFFITIAYLAIFVKETIPIDSNQRIVKVMTNDFYRYDSIFYKPVAQVLSRIPYDGDMTYYFYSSPGVGIHELEGPYGDLNDTFPWVASELRTIKVKFKILYSVFIHDGIVFIDPLTGSLTNSNRRRPCFEYSTWSDYEIQELYNNYRIYDILDTVDDTYTGGWLKRIEKNWYIISFD